MIVVVDGANESVFMEDAAALDSLTVELRACARERARELLAGFGRIDGGHIWLEITQLRALSPEQHDVDWGTGFDAAMDYARSKGWTDLSGDVRAHIA